MRIFKSINISEVNCIGPTSHNRFNQACAVTTKKSRSLSAHNSSKFSAKTSATNEIGQSQDLASMEITWVNNTFVEGHQSKFILT